MKGLLNKTLIILMAFCFGYTNIGFSMEHEYEAPKEDEISKMNESEIIASLKAHKAQQEKLSDLKNKDLQTTTDKTLTENYYNEALREHNTTGIKLQNALNKKQIDQLTAEHKKSVKKDIFTPLKEYWDNLKKEMSEAQTKQAAREQEEASNLKMSIEGLFGPDVERSPTTTEEKNNAKLKELEQEFNSFKSKEEAKIQKFKNTINFLNPADKSLLPTMIEENKTYKREFDKLFPESNGKVTQETAEEFLQKLKDQTSQLERELPEKLSQKQQDIEWQKSEIQGDVKTQRDTGRVYTPTREDQQQAISRASRKAKPELQRALAERNRAQTKVNNLTKELTEKENQLNIDLNNVKNKYTGKDYLYATAEVKNELMTKDQQNLRNKFEQDKQTLQSQLNTAQDQLEKAQDNVEKLDGTQAARQEAARQEATREAAREAAKAREERIDKFMKDTAPQIEQIVKNTQRWVNPDRFPRLAKFVDSITSFFKKESPKDSADVEKSAEEVKQAAKDQEPSRLTKAMNSLLRKINRVRGKDVPTTLIIDAARDLNNDDKISENLNRLTTALNGTTFEATDIQDLANDLLTTAIPNNKHSIDIGNQSFEFTNSNVQDNFETMVDMLDTFLPTDKELKLTFKNNKPQYTLVDKVNEEFDSMTDADDFDDNNNNNNNNNNNMSQSDSFDNSQEMTDFNNNNNNTQQNDNESKVDASPIKELTEQLVKAKNSKAVTQEAIKFIDQNPKLANDPSVRTAILNSLKETLGSKTGLSGYSATRRESIIRKDILPLINDGKTPDIARKLLVEILNAKSFVGNKEILPHLLQNRYYLTTPLPAV